MNKKLYWLSQIVLISALGLILYAMYLSFWPIYPLVVKIQPAKVLTPVVRVGEVLFYEVDYCRKGDYSAKVYRTISGKTIVPTPVVNTVTVAGCRTAVVPLPIPVGTPAGTYHLEIIAEFHPNPTRTINYKFITEEFNVTK